MTMCFLLLLKLVMEVLPFRIMILFNSVFSFLLLLNILTDIYPTILNKIICFRLSTHRNSFARRRRWPSDRCPDSSTDPFHCWLLLRLLLRRPLLQQPSCPRLPQRLLIRWAVARPDRDCRIWVETKKWKIFIAYELINE